MKRLLGLFIIVAGAVAAAHAPSGFGDQSNGGRSVPPSTEWPTYGHDSGGMRFSPLEQITPANVSQLEVAWVYHMRPPVTEPANGAPAQAQGGRGRGRGGSGFAASETTPIVVNGIMYISTPYNRVVALDPTTGKEAWAFQV